MEKFGKSFKDVLGIKQDFFTKNEELKKNLDAIDEVYRQQPPRTACKTCFSDVATATFFTRNHIRYYTCSTCGHLNGEFEDSAEFCNYLYGDNEEGYGKTYSSSDKADYEQRTQNIYVPKAEFLLASLREQGEAVDNLKFIDIGAGTGYFVHAMGKNGIQHITGHEVSKSQVLLGQQVVGEDRLKLLQLGDTENFIRSVHCDVVSAIGVIEHLQDPHSILKAVSENAAIKYLYFSVPLHSFTDFMQLVFPDVMERNLAAGHTHLYTQSSLAWLANHYGFSIVSEWWFGGDMLDFYRSTLVRFQSEGLTQPLLDEWSAYILPLLNDLQLTIDRSKKSSEVHMLFKKASAS